MKGFFFAAVLCQNEKIGFGKYVGSTSCNTVNMHLQTNMEGGQSGIYLRLTRASSGLRVSIAKTYRDETKPNEYFGQITVAFLSSRIQETEAKLLVLLG